MIETVARLLAADPAGLGGAVLRGPPGAWRDAFLHALAAALGPARPMRRLPLSATADRLTGGLDLAATLGAGRPVHQQGLIADCHGGALVVPMAERLPPLTAALLAAALDRGIVPAATGVARPARLLLILLDEGVDDERIPALLAERLAFELEPDATIEGLPVGKPVPDPIPPLCAVAAGLGVGSLRATGFALRTAHGLAALAGRSVPHEGDLALAVRLVLAPRATRVPEDAAGDSPARDAPPEQPDAGEGTEGSGIGTETEMLVDAARAMLPADLVEQLARRGPRAVRTAGGGRGLGARARAPSSGRRVGVRQGRPRPGAPLDLVETLKAAAPWQAMRKGAGQPRLPLAIRPDDFRVRRLARRQGSTIILVVDASGSTALARLGEAKGAAELLLADAYVRRDEVALIAFRGDQAELLLPPTRSLVRARRALSDLAAGGGTPLAAALREAERLAIGVRARGSAPLLVLLTDGRANVASPGEDPMAAALAAGRRLAAASLPGLFIDTAARPRGEGQALAAAMGARHLALPRVEAGAVRDAVRSMEPAR